MLITYYFESLHHQLLSQSLLRSIAILSVIMVLNFGLSKEESSRHLSISNHKLRSIDKKGKPKTKNRNASSKDYEDSSSDEESISVCESIDSDFEFDVAAHRKSYASSYSSLSVLGSEFAPLSVSSPKTGKASKKSVDGIDFEKAEKEDLNEGNQLVNSCAQEKAYKVASAAAAVAQIRSNLQSS